MIDLKKKRRQKVRIQSPGGHSLVGLLELPIDLDPYAVAVFAHCFTCNKNFAAMRYISKALQAHDIAVLRFDFTGLGESEGAFADTTFSSNLQDLLAACTFMDAHFGDKPKILLGHSLGGAAVLHAANKINHVEAVVTVGAPFEPYHVTHLFEHRIKEIKALGKLQMDIGGRKVWIGRDFVEEIKNHSSKDYIRNLKKPLLILHSPQDRVVGIENAAKIYNAAFHPKSFISLHGADHLLSASEDALYAGNIIAGWVRKYLPPPQEEDIQTNSFVAARIDDDDDFTVQIKSGRHRLIMDEPKTAGGKNIGPDPYSFLASAIAGSTAMMLQWYAKQRGWPLEEVIVHVNQDRQHAADCPECEVNLLRAHQFEKRIELKGALDDAQREALYRMAEQCPVQRSIEGGIIIKSSDR